MPIRITIDIFSGVPNPVVVLSSKEAQAVLERLKPGNALVADEAEKATTPILGYRGLIIEQTGPSPADESLPARFRVASGALVGGGLAHRAADAGFESYFFSSKGPSKKLKGARKLLTIVKQEVERAKETRDQIVLPTTPFPITLPCACGPLYEPGWWNDGGQKQLNNNCYNYDELSERYFRSTWKGGRRDVHAIYLRFSSACSSERRS